MFHRRLWFPLTLVVLNSGSGLLTAQSPIVSPTFDVASIKPYNGEPRGHRSNRPDRTV